MRVDFLRKYGIDFFEPYYADCAGMTEAMAKAEKMVSVSIPAYCLTMNTSQTTGSYTWDSYYSIFVNQWKSVKEVFIREKYENIDDIGFVAMRIVDNLVANIKSLLFSGCWMIIIRGALGFICL